jgi:hypothetical protein
MYRLINFLEFELGWESIDWSQISWIGSPLMGKIFVSLLFFLNLCSMALIFFGLRSLSVVSLDANDGIFLVPW